MPSIPAYRMLPRMLVTDRAELPRGMHSDSPALFFLDSSAPMVDGPRTPPRQENVAPTAATARADSRPDDLQSHSHSHTLTQGK